MSRKITIVITKNIKQIQYKTQKDKEIVLNKIESIIRKIAHFSIYTVVGFLLMTLCTTYKIKEFDCISISLILGVIYASLDEIHQVFTPSRGPSIFDVILDGQGVLFGICISLLMIKLIKVYMEYRNSINKE